MVLNRVPRKVGSAKRAKDRFAGWQFVLRATIPVDSTAETEDTSFAPLRIAGELRKCILSGCE